MVSFALPSSSSMVPVPEISTSWGSSFHAFSTSSSYRPLSTSLSRARSGVMRPLLRLLLPGRSHSPFAPLRPQGVVKAAYVCTQRLISSSGAPDHAIAVRLDARGAPSSLRTPLLRRGRKRFPGGVAALAYRQLCKLLRVSLPPPALMVLQRRG